MHRAGSQSGSWTLDGTESEGRMVLYTVSQGTVTSQATKLSLTPSHQVFSLLPRNIPRIVQPVLYLAWTITMVFRVSCSLLSSLLQFILFLEWLLKKKKKHNVFIIVSLTSLKSFSASGLSSSQIFHLAEHTQVFMYLPSEPGDVLSRSFTFAMQSGQTRLHAGPRA